MTGKKSNDDEFLKKNLKQKELQLKEIETNLKD
jgi:hypothetical protein